MRDKVDFFAFEKTVISYRKSLYHLLSFAVNLKPL